MGRVCPKEASLEKGECILAKGCLMCWAKTKSKRAVGKCSDDGCPEHSPGRGRESRTGSLRDGRHGLVDRVMQNT